MFYFWYPGIPLTSEQYYYHPQIRISRRTQSALWLERRKRDSGVLVIVSESQGTPFTFTTRGQQAIRSYRSSFKALRKSTKARDPFYDSTTWRLLLKLKQTRTPHGVSIAIHTVVPFRRHVIAGNVRGMRNCTQFACLLTLHSRRLKAVTFAELPLFSPAFLVIGG